MSKEEMEYSEFRYCKLKRKWILFAPNRLKKPIEFVEEKSKDDIKNCPFEVGREHLTPKEICRITDDKGWRCRVIPNLYNALSIEREPISHRDGFFQKFEGFGAHEIIIETPEHSKQMHNFSSDDFYYYLEIIKQRIIELQKDKRIKYISIFKNSGKYAGASLSHSHSQLIGMPFIPQKILNEIDYKKNYYVQKHITLFDDIIYDEKKQEKGIIINNDYFFAYTPYASEFPFEITIVPNLKKASLINFDRGLIIQLSRVLANIYKKLYTSLGDFSYNMTINNAPFENFESINMEDIYRFHIKILPRLSYIAGFELDSGVFINPLKAEEAAKILKGDYKTIKYL